MSLRVIETHSKYRGHIISFLKKEEMATDRMNDKFQSAVEQYHAGNLRRAESLFQEILYTDPNNADVLHLLGLISYQDMQYDKAGDYFKRVLDADPNYSEAYFALADILHIKGEFDSAITHFKKAIQLDPSNADAYYDLGNIYLERKEFDEAIKNYLEALQINANDRELLNNLGIAYKGKKQLYQAISCFRKAIEIDPHYVTALNNLGLVLQDTGHFKEATELYQHILKLDPDFVEAYFNLGNIFAENYQCDEAVDSYGKALQLKPDFVDAFVNLGVCLSNCGQYDEAIQAYTKALSLNPRSEKVLCLLGNTFRDKGQMDEAIDTYKQALQVNPKYVEPHWRMADALLLAGRLKEGWAENEWRKVEEQFHLPYFAEPFWDGSDITGKTILLRAEGGFGDTIQFIRYASLVAQKGAKVILLCQRELVSILQDVDGIKEIYSRREELPPYDVQCPLLSLPSVFGTTLERVPASVPYIHVRSSSRDKWIGRNRTLDTKLKIGLTWAGNPKHLQERYRSFHFELFLPLFKLDYCTFYSLQKGEAAKQARTVSLGMKFIDHSEDIHDFADTAALIETLDLIISVDTAVAHLAGALDKPVWMLLSSAPNWRWMMDREDSPWYPSMRLFRQSSLGDWSYVIAKVMDELQRNC